MCGADGCGYRVRVNWEQFGEWQRWDEYPERADDPPMTLDMAFWYEGEKYYLVYEYGEYRIVDHDWNRVAGNPNMLTLLTDPIEAWGNHSFKELIEQLEFED